MATTTANQTAYEYARDTLGPVFAEYLTRLDLYARHFASEQSAKVLFVSRAGVRLRRLYQTYLISQDLLETPNDFLWISRFACAKGAWNSAFTLSCTILENEFSGGTLGDIVKAIFRGTSAPDELDFSDSILKRPAAGFSEFIWGESSAAYFTRWHLTEQSNLFSEYVRETLAGHQRAALVDSGWQGTSQNLLAQTFPEVDWWGLYFGRIGTPQSDRRNWHNVVGLAFEADEFVPSDPRSSIVLHRHLIESLLEPFGDSIEFFARGANGKVFAPQAATVENEYFDRDNSPIFVGVRDHLRSLRLGISRREIEASANLAWSELSRAITFPTSQDVANLALPPRSADFGRDISVPVVLTPESRWPGDSAEARISHSLWPQGQIRLEYPTEVVEARQRQALKEVAGKPPALFTPARSVRPTVAVITRTMDRPWFLTRALRSVSDQSYDDYVHVVVCDGGPIEKVREIISSSGVDLRKVQLIDNVTNRGMEAASNIGIAHSNSDFVVIHDDDDTWHPDFLKEAVFFLSSSGRTNYGGVITSTVYVSEEVEPSGIKLVSTMPYNDWVDQVQLSEMVTNNFFAPIAFLFRRDVYDSIGGYDESFPVLGDWDFNIRFLKKANIGVIKKPLANYHHRDTGNKGLYANSLFGMLSSHAEYNAILRNKHARESGTGQDSPTVLGAMFFELRRTMRDSLQVSQHIQARMGSDESVSVDWALIADTRWVQIHTLLGALNTRKANAGDGRVKELTDRLASAEKENESLKRTLAESLQQTSFN